MLLINEFVNPSIYTPNHIIEKVQNNLEFNRPYGNLICGGTYLNQNDSFIYYFVKRKSVKEEILKIFNNEIYFDKNDELAAEREIKKLTIEKKGNFYNYYD